MARRKSIFRQMPLYREVRQAYRAAAIYHKLGPYLAHRFSVAPRLARLAGPLDRPVDTDRYSIHLLCSHGDVLPMLWALASWHAFAADSAQVFIHEDGSFTPGDRAVIGQLFPQARIMDYAAMTQKSGAEWLKDYPSAWRFRGDPSHFYSAKLMDPVFASPARGLLIMDTDILWFRTPRELHHHIEEYHGAVFWPSSGVPSRQPFSDGTELRLDLAALNSGIVYFERAAFDMRVLEEYCAKLPPGWPLLDQPGYAYVLGQKAPVTTLPVEHYHIHGAAHAETIGKHYTGPRREQFWFEGVARLKGRLLGE